MWCISQDYENLGRMGEGTYSVVAKCRHRPTGTIVAVKMFKDSDKQVSLLWTFISHHKGGRGQYIGGSQIEVHT